MKCPYCACVDSKVVDSRSVEDNSAVRRRRLCEGCGKRFTTYEKIENIPVVVIKNNKTREAFDRSKLLKGVMLACKKRPVSVEQMEALVYNVEMSVENTMKKEIDSSEIGRIVMEKLKDLDQVAYVRFASVYRKFTDIDSFAHELGILLKEKGHSMF